MFDPSSISALRHPQFGLVFGSVLCAAALFNAGTAHAGPCTAQIIAFNQQIKTITPGPESGPTAPQTVGAQLHHQPTPGAVEHAEHVANKDADAALAKAREADAKGDAAGCRAALKEARRLYAINK
ncbi:MAG TPA: hypothetical protein VH206_11850 [Xanthobacteraceae bacterium]|jgi:hypothetical protein|nr:hypothetical protein [Xanthobacteraceae bacterium]